MKWHNLPNKYIKSLYDLTFIYEIKFKGCKEYDDSISPEIALFFDSTLDLYLGPNNKDSRKKANGFNSFCFFFSI